MKHLNIRISGKVQGVGFRMSAQYIAAKLNLFGFVRNEEDGTVYLEVEGKKENLEKFLNWCKKGSPSALVEKTESEYSPELKHFIDFQIL